MSAESTVSAETATAADPPARARWRRWRGPLAAVAALVVVAVGVVLLRGTGNDRYLDPDGTGPHAAGAVASVLAENGVEVTRVPDLAAAVSTVGASPAGTRATVLVARPDLLTNDDGLATLLSAPNLRVVLVAEDPAVTQLPALTKNVPGLAVEAGDFSGPRRPACPLPLAAGLGTALVDGTTFTADRPGTGCFARAGRPSLLSLDATADRSQLLLLGDGELLTNEAVGDDDNAALALRLLGGSTDRVARLVWVQPTAADLAGAAGGGGQSLTDLIPLGPRLMALQGAVAVLLLACWRARRLGPVVVEPLPVVVRSAEVVEGRGRLYARHRSRDRAAALLRQGVLAPVRQRLGLPADAEPAGVVRAVAARAGRPEAEVGNLLYGAAPGDDAALVRLAGELDRLATDLRTDRAT